MKISMNKWMLIVKVLPLLCFWIFLGNRVKKMSSFCPNFSTEDICAVNLRTGTSFSIQSDTYLLNACIYPLAAWLWHMYTSLQHTYKPTDYKLSWQLTWLQVHINDPYNFWKNLTIFTYNMHSNQNDTTDIKIKLLDSIKVIKMYGWFLDAYTLVRLFSFSYSWRDINFRYIFCRTFMLIITGKNYRNHELKH